MKHIPLKTVPSAWAAAAAIIAIAVGLHLASGLRFPVPWVDESYFLLQSLSFAQGNSFFAPELIPDRPLMWMPPGYMVLLGGLFKFVEFSLRHARELSLAFYCVAIAVFCRALCGGRPNLRHLIAAVIFLVPSSFVVSNVARMEAMILAFGLGAMAASMGGRFILAGALVLGGALIHPNGVYFGLPVLFAAVLAMRGGRFMGDLRRTSWLDWTALVVALVGAGLYLALIARHLDGFRIDMAFQFARKLDRPPFYRDAKSMAQLGLALAATVAFLWRGRAALAVPAAFAAIMVLIAINGQEMWYQVFRNVGLGLLMVLILGELRPAALRWAVATGAVLVVVAVAGLSFAGMRPSRGGDYFGETAAAKLRQDLLAAQQATGGRLSVTFNLTGADLLFLDFLRVSGIELVRRMPTEITPPRPVDLCVCVDRPQDPAWLRVAWSADLPVPSLCRSGALLSPSADEVIRLDAAGYAAHYEALRQARPDQAQKRF